MTGAATAAAGIGAAGAIGSAAIGKPKKAKDPNAYLLPYLQQGAQAAQGLFDQGPPQQWQGSTVAPLSDVTQSAISGIVDRSQGSPLIDTAQGYVQQGLQQPISTSFGGMQNPYARPVSSGSSYNPYSASVGGGAQDNPYATSANPFGAGQNPGLDAAFDYAAQKSRSQLDSEFAGAGRNLGASAPARADMLSSLAAQIYAPAYENERNRELSYSQQQLGIGGTGFENAQSRNLNANLAGQQIGAQSYQAGQDRRLQSNLNAQNIGAQGYENSQNRALSDLTSQRGLQQNLLGYASPLAAQDYLDLAQRQQAGGLLDAQSQAQLSDQVNRFNEQQQAPQQNLDAYLQRLMGLAGKAGQPMPATPQPNYLSAGLGGALLGSALFPQQQQTAANQPYMGNFNLNPYFPTSGLM